MKIIRFNRLIIKSSFSMIYTLFVRPGDAITESGDDPEVIRAKYFIRDEFLVSQEKNLTNTHTYTVEKNNGNDLLSFNLFNQ